MMRPRVAMVILSSLIAACRLDEAPAPNPLSSFQVSVVGVFQRAGATRISLPVVASCVGRYGSQNLVPSEVKGHAECPYAIPRGEVEFDIKAQATGVDGQAFVDFNGPVSFRIVPGELVQDQSARWSMAKLGAVEATVRALHPYGEARIWVEDGPPLTIYDGGVVPTELLPPEPMFPARRTFASGVSPSVHFADQTLQSLQVPSDFDNRSSPFAGDFVVVGKNPSSGSSLRHTCMDDPSRDGKPALMVITGLDPSGFFVTDISACRLREMLMDSTGSTVRTPEPSEPCWLSIADGGREENLDGGSGRCTISDRACTRRADCPGYSPGTFASMFVYNYNFPENLDEGDLLFTLSGSVQEFTSTTQMVFPSWTVAERVRRLPQVEWNKWLQFVTPYDINSRTCGQDNSATPFLTDALCGHNRRNLKMESLESALVRLRRVRFPQQFVSCDFNANGSVPFFCETRPQGSVWQWSTCSFDSAELEADRLERECNQNCVIGMGEQAGRICSERSTFRGFGQYVVEMALPGPSTLGLDDALSLRIQTAIATLGPQVDSGEPQNPSVRVGGYGAGSEVAITCSEPVRYHPGPSDAVAGEGDPLISPNQIVRHVFGPAESAVAFQALSRQATCTVGLNARTRINLITRDAVPELNPDCDEANPVEERARQCQYLRAAEFDVIGHLRQVQPARPRWVVIPRAPDDLCCYPGPGLKCPVPIKPCP